MPCDGTQWAVVGEKKARMSGLAGCWLIAVLLAD